MNQQLRKGDCIDLSRNAKCSLCEYLFGHSSPRLVATLVAV